MMSRSRYYVKCQIMSTSESALVSQSTFDAAKASCSPPNGHSHVRQQVHCYRYSKELCTKKSYWRVVVVAPLVERSLPTPEFRCSNPAIDKIYIVHCLLSTVLKKEMKKKRPGMAHLFKKRSYWLPR